MAVELATAYVSIVPSAQGMARSLGQQLDGPAAAAGASAGKQFGGGMNKALAAGGGLIVAGQVSKFLGSATAAAREANKVSAQTEAVLKSTGAVAGVTADSVDKLATALSRKTGVDDELIASGQNLLLTFTGVKNEIGEGNDVFSQATALAVDMSAALGQDMKSSAMQLGKALNDPVQGMNALRRVGVAFTGEQKVQIKTLAEAGDRLGAQKIILRELASEFGGSAEAQATAADKLKVTMGNLQESIGQALVPVLETLAKVITPIVDAFVSLPGPAQTVIVAIAGIAAVALAIGMVLPALTGGFAALAGIIPAVSTALAFLAANPIVLIVVGVAAVVAGLILLYKNSQTVRDIVAALGETFQAFGGLLYDIVAGIISAASGVLDWLGNNWQTIFAIMAGPFGLVAKFVFDHFDQIVAFVTALPGRISRAASGMWDGIKNAFKAAMNFIIRAWNALDFKVGAFDPPGPGPTFPGFTLGLPDIEELGDGGVVMPRPGGVLARLAERGQPEVVLPLSKLAGLAGSPDGGSAAPVFHVTAPSTDADEIVRAQNRELRKQQYLLGV